MTPDPIIDRPPEAKDSTKMPMLYLDTPADADPCDNTAQIYERNGIWVVKIDGVWRGDYVKRVHAVAAVRAARHVLPHPPR